VAGSRAVTVAVRSAARIEIADPDTGDPDHETAAAVQRQAIQRGLIVELGGRDDCVVRLLPPLNVSRETMDQALEILDAALKSAQRGPWPTLGRGVMPGSA
jgi:diaminobutyrate-2-oxoglutarate transaminase